MFDRIIVSTDSKKIASISENYGAEIPFLRDKYSDDNSNNLICRIRINQDEGEKSDQTDDINLLKTLESNLLQVNKDIFFV